MVKSCVADHVFPLFGRRQPNLVLWLYFRFGHVTKFLYQHVVKQGQKHLHPDFKKVPKAAEVRDTLFSLRVFTTPALFFHLFIPTALGVDVLR